MKPKKESNTPSASSKMREFLAVLIALAAVFFFFVVLPGQIRAGANEDLQKKIDESNAKIAELEKEIAAYETRLIGIGNEKKTLEGEVGRLDLSRKKIGTDIAVTENRVSAATLELEDLGGEISDKERRIVNGRAAIGKSFRTLHQIEDITLVEHILSATRLNDAWEESDKLRQLEANIQNEIKT